MNPEPETDDAVAEPTVSCGQAAANLNELLACLDADPRAIDEHDAFGELRKFGQKLTDRSEPIPPNLAAEQIAFLIYAADHGQVSSWGLYFGPMMSGLSSTGEPWDTPALGDATPEVLEHWRARAAASAHPILRARYADLLWELPNRLEHGRPDAAMARIAIDSYLEAVAAHRYSDEVTRIAKVKRALELALSIGDADRVARARDILLAMDDGQADDSDVGLWAFAFDTLIEPPNKKVPLTDYQRAAVIANVEMRAERSARAASGEYHPGAAEDAAVRLATYYRRAQRPDDVRRVLNQYRIAVLALDETAPAFIQAHSLEQLYDLYQQFGLPDEAAQLDESLRVAGERSNAEMKSVSTEISIKAEDVDKFYLALLAGTPDQALTRIASHFVPDRAELTTQLNDLARKAVIAYMITRVIKDDGGRTVARVGSLDSDPEGQLLLHVSQNMQINIPWLRDAFARGEEAGVVSFATVGDFVFACPFFTAKRRSMIERGLRAYFESDPLTAVHILIPQIEQAVRELATMLRAQIYSPRRGGGLHLRTLDELLRDGVIVEVMGEDISSYLRLLLTDARGWNLRNNVCHGLAPAGMVSVPSADRVLHAMLAIALFRPMPTGGGDAQPIA